MGVECELNKTEYKRTEGTNRSSYSTSARISEYRNFSLRITTRKDVGRKKSRVKCVETESTAILNRILCDKRTNKQDKNKSYYTIFKSTDICSPQLWPTNDNREILEAT